MESRDYSPLLVKPKTEEAVIGMLCKRIPYEIELSSLRDLIVFEEEAIGLMDYLKRNPQATKTEIRNALLQMTREYAQSIGMSTSLRETYSSMISQRRKKPIDYGSLKVKPETEKAAMEMLNKRNISKKILEILNDWIVFEEDANRLMDYLKQNPQASETEILNAFLQMVWEYAQSIGMSTTLRELYSSRE